MAPETMLRHLLVRLPLRRRRKLLRGLWLAARGAGQLPDFGIAPTLIRVLRVPRAEALRIEQEIAYQDWIVMTEWAAVLDRPVKGLRADAEAIRYEGGEILRKVADSGEPVMFMPLHMGCYALCFARIMRDFFADRRMLILRAREDREEETQAMRRISEIGTDMRFLNVADKQSYIDAVKFAREGAVIVSFADLPGSYGGATATHLFSTPVQLAMGIDSLARVVKATVVPVAVRSGVEGDVIHVGRPFQTFEKSELEKQRFVAAIRRHLEDAIRNAPEQWHMWARFDEYRNDILQSEAA